ncbi:MAG: heparinase II/III family protein [Nitrososphaerales archaeon]
MSYVLEVQGREILVDPGTGGYTRDPVMRDRMRSTCSHATVEIDGAEINRIVPNRLFSMEDDDAPRVELVELAGDDRRALGHIVASHRGYMRLRDPVLHRRSWRLDSNSLHVRDELECAGPHTVVISFPLASEVTARESASGWLIERDGIVVTLQQVEGPSMVLVSEALSVSPRYGDVRQSQVLRGRLSITGNVRWTYQWSIANGTRKHR